MHDPRGMYEYMTLYGLYFCCLLAHEFSFYNGTGAVGSRNENLVAIVENASEDNKSMKTSSGKSKWTCNDIIRSYNRLV